MALGHLAFVCQVQLSRLAVFKQGNHEINASLSAETRFDPLLQRVLFETVKIAQAQAGLIYLCENKGTQLEPHGLIIDGPAPGDGASLPAVWFGGRM